MKPTWAILGICIAANTAAAQKHEKTIEISAPVSVARATELVQLAILKEGLMVQSNQGGVITLAPYDIEKAKHINVSLRANIIGNDSASSIVLGGSWADHTLAAVMQNKPGAQALWKADGTIEAGYGGGMKQAWKELERLRDAIKAQLASKE